MSLESIRRPIATLGDVRSALSRTHISNAAIAFIFAISAPVAIILGVGVSGGLSEADMASWLFGAFFINGLLTLGMSLIYRVPVVFFWTIPGTVLVGPALQHLSFAEVIGAFHMTAVLLLILGLSGSVRRIMSAMPMPIIMAMVAAVFLRFGLAWINAIKDDIWIALPMTLTFFLLPLIPGVQRRIPPLIGVLIVGAVAVYFSESGASGFKALDFSDGLQDIAALPSIYRPVFSIRAMVELVIPLSITVIAAQNAQGIAILQSQGHQPPVNAITTACGVVSSLSALVGCVSTCLAGPSNALVGSSGDRQGHYAAAILLAIFAIIFGILSPLFTKLILAAPAAYIATLAGLAMLRVLESAFKISFQTRFTLGALVTFLVTIADHPIFNIGAPVWGLLFGFLTSWLLERDDFSAARASANQGQSLNASKS